MRTLRLLQASAALLCFIVSADQCCAQGSLHITFDGAPAIAPGTGQVVQEYYESGIAFTPIDPNAPGAGFGRRGANPTPGWPDSGTTYIQAGLLSTLKFSFPDGSLFGLASVDLAEYSDVLRDPVTVRFVGYRPDGSTATAAITTGGIFNGVAPVFQTFYFAPDFTGFERVEIPSVPWSLDNLVVSIPEPAGLTLLLLGTGFCIASVRHRRMSRSARFMRGPHFSM